MSDSMRWYVVHTYSGYENKVATNIEKAVENRKFHDLIGEVIVLINSFIYSLYLYAFSNLTKERIFLLSIQYIYILQ